jgi:hypothetical protein
MKSALNGIQHFSIPCLLYPVGYGVLGMTKEAQLIGQVHIIVWVQQLDKNNMNIGFYCGGNYICYLHGLTIHNTALQSKTKRRKLSK